MTAVPTTATPTVLHERHQVYDFDVSGYIKSLGLTSKDVAHTLRVTDAQLSLWKRERWLPRAVWKKAISLWSRQGFDEPKTRESKRACRLDVSYADLLGVRLPAPPPVEPPPPVKPESVAFDVFESVVMLLMHQNAALLAEKAVTDADNTRLYKIIALLQAENGFADLVGSVDRIGSIPLSVEPKPEIRSEISKHLKDLSRYNGNGAVLADLEKRIPFVTASRS